MFSNTVKERVEKEIYQLKSKGNFKVEHVISGPQGPKVFLGNKKCLNFCSNNYLGLSNSKELIDSVIEDLYENGLGTSSVRFICGTQKNHIKLEKELSNFLSTDSAILFSSCFDANTGFFETILSESDAIISDELNHASIIDGVRLCKAGRYRYKNNDMRSLETVLHKASMEKTGLKIIVTDGVFSMDGVICNLREVCDLAEKYDALVMVDDSHGVGVMGKTGGGTPQHFGVESRVDIVSGTFGKALGGASGGYIAGRKPIIELLRQSSRPYLFSNSIAPPVVAATLKALSLVEGGQEVRSKLRQNVEKVRETLLTAGFVCSGGGHPIIPIILGDSHLALSMAERLLEKGIFVTPFSYPVVPVGKSRIRLQISASHSSSDIDNLLDSLISVGKSLNIIN